MTTHMQLTPDQQRTLLNVARHAIREALRGNADARVPQTNDTVLNVHAGCFVTLHDAATHRLRGCVGRLQSEDPLIVGIHETAQSVLQDPRFTHHRVTLGDLPLLDIEISVLSPLVQANGPLDFDLLNDGIFLIIDGRQGTFLPQVARETGWNKEQLLERLCTEKMGLPADAWRHPSAKLLRYSTLLIGPVPFDEPTPSPQASVGRFSGSFASGNVFKLS
jgi:AmmeMemoRadiSam system protein A